MAYPAVLADLEWVVFIRVQKVGSTSAEHHLRATLNSSLGWGATHTFGWEPLHCQSCSGFAAIAPCSTRASCFAPGGACSRGPLPRLLVNNVPHVTLRDAVHLLPLPVRSPRVAVLTWLRHPYTRVLSEFRHSGEGAGWDYESAYNASACGLFSFANWARCSLTARGASNRQTRMLSTEEGVNSCEQPTRKSLQSAKSALTDVVRWFGLFECAQLSLCMLQVQLFAAPAAPAWPLQEANTLHGTTWASFAEEVTPTALVLVRERNELDSELVHFARGLLLSRASNTKCAREACVLR